EADAAGASGTDLSVSGSRELGDLPLRGDPADLLEVVFREPEGSVGPGDDAVGSAAFRGNGELGNVTLWRDFPDLVGFEFSEPEVAVGSKGKITRERLRGRDRKHGELPRKRHGPDGIALVVGAPEILVRTDDQVLNDRGFRGPAGSLEIVRQGDIGDFPIRAYLAHLGERS